MVKRDANMASSPAHDAQLDPETFASAEKVSSPRGDDVFGDDSGDTKYRSMEWWQAGSIMIAETVSIGILSLPSVLARIGFVPGVILIITLGIAATYAGYVLGQFKKAYPWVHTFAEVGEVIGAPIGIGPLLREVLGAGQVIFFIFAMASHVLTWTICLNTLTGHATCTVVWSVVGLVLFVLLTLPRTLRSVSWLSVVSCASIVSSLLITMIDLGVDPPAPGHITSTKPVEFATAFNAVANIVFAYAGQAAFFSFISELRNPNDFPKALLMLQSAAIGLYLTAAVVIYYYAGDAVTSPALGSTGPLIRRIAYGIAIPTILIAGVVYGHVNAKQIYVRLFRGTRHLGANTVFAYATWAGLALSMWVIAWVIAESIPSFNNLQALVSALFASWFTYGLAGVMWLFLNWGRLLSSPTKMLLTVANVVLILMGGAICGIGLYTSGKAIHESPAAGVWTCADNAS